MTYTISIMAPRKPHFHSKEEEAAYNAYMEKRSALRPVAQHLDWKIPSLPGYVERLTVGHDHARFFRGVFKAAHEWEGANTAVKRSNDVLQNSPSHIFFGLVGGTTDQLKRFDVASYFSHSTPCGMQVLSFGSTYLIRKHVQGISSRSLTR